MGLEEVTVCKRVSVSVSVWKCVIAGVKVEGVCVSARFSEPLEF